MKILITGFEPFGKYTENSSWVAAEEIAAQKYIGIDVAIEPMPVSFRRVAATLRDAVDRHDPDLLIMLGQSGGSDKVRLERIAINMMDSKNADNDGYIPDEETIDAKKPPALFTNTDIKSLYKAIEEAGVPVMISNTCGLYVCNRLYYEGLLLCNERPEMKTLFIHLPLYEGQKGNNHTLPIPSMVKAISIIIEKQSNDWHKRL